MIYASHSFQETHPMSWGTLSPPTALIYHILCNVDMTASVVDVRGIKGTNDTGSECKPS